MSFLSIRNLTKDYGEDVPALSGFSLEIPQGNLLSLVGESGSGKTTLLRIIAGLETQDHGEVYLDGGKVLNPSEKLVPGYDEIQLVDQQDNLYPRSTVEENITRPLLSYTEDYRRNRVEAMLDLLGLQKHRRKFPRQLSGGQQQKVAIGRALGVEPQVLLMDEPFSNLDNIQKRGLIEELRTIFQKLRLTVLMVTHDVDEAMLLADQLCILRGGRLVQKGTGRDIYQQPINFYVANLFSDLNPIPAFPDRYIRPADLFLERNQGKLKGEIVSSQYLISHNRLEVMLEESHIKWRAEDAERTYQVGEQVFLTYAEENVLKF